MHSFGLLLTWHCSARRRGRSDQRNPDFEKIQDGQLLVDTLPSFATDCSRLVISRLWRFVACSAPSFAFAYVLAVTSHYYYYFFLFSSRVGFGLGYE